MPHQTNVLWHFCYKILIKREGDPQLHFSMLSDPWSDTVSQMQRMKQELWDNEIQKGHRPKSVAHDGRSVLTEIPLTFVLQFPLYESVLHLGQESRQIKKCPPIADYCKTGTQLPKISSTQHEWNVIPGQKYPNRAQIIHRMSLHCFIPTKKSVVFFGGIKLLCSDFLGSLSTHLFKSVLGT